MRKPACAPEKSSSSLPGKSRKPSPTAFAPKASATINFAHIQKYVDDIVTVTEDEIRHAIKLLATNPATVAEPSGAVAVAGFLFRRDQLPDTQLNVAIISGGNLEPSLLEELRDLNDRKG